MPEFNLPIKGVYYGMPVDKSPPMTSGYMNNIRAVDALEKRVRIGQRLGLDKVYTQQIASVASPIVEICSVTVAS